MTAEHAGRLVAVLVTSALATAALAFAARRIGWTDAPGARDAARKLQRRAVPTVGGAALLVALLVAPVKPWSAGSLALLERFWPAPHWIALSLSALFALGTIDDRWPLRAGPKALAQLAALAPFVAGAREAGAGSGMQLALLAGGFVAVNALNTFDNADGALAGLLAAGFLVAQPAVSAACLGFLPLNLDSGRRANRASGAPSAYLGDAGSHALAFVVLALPQSWGLLVLPLLDLARLSVVRVAEGSRPWIGDRRHLAHRLLARGCSPALTALVLALVAAPACVLVALAVERGDALLAAAGAGATAVAFGIAVRASAARERRSRA